jgi:hypothetical protein
MWVMDLRAARRSGSEVLEPRWRDTLGRAESVVELALVEERVRTRTLSFGFVARAVACG